MKSVFECKRPSENVIQQLLFLTAETVAQRLRDLERKDYEAGGCGVMRAYARQAAFKEVCVCCIGGTPTSGPGICPICRHEFQGNGWDGISAHWRAHHEGFMRYEIIWDGVYDIDRQGHATGG